MNNTSRQRTGKKTMDWNNTIEQMKLIDMYRTFYPAAAEYSSQVHTEHFLGYTIC